MGESERGCGYRQHGGVYLVGDGISVACDALPLELATCPHCDFRVKQSRTMQVVHMGYLAGIMRDHKCKENFNCPLCETVRRYDRHRGNKKALKKRRLTGFFLMFVSKGFYTPESFIDEANEMGVSKRIAPNSLPKDFKVGRDYVFLAHGKVPFKGEAKGDMGALNVDAAYKRAIFYGFKPRAIQIILYKDDPADVIAAYDRAGYEVVLIDPTPENREKHGYGKLPPLPKGGKL